MINILLVDDQKTSQQFLKNSLENEPDFKIIGIANNGQEAIEQVAKFQPNIVIMDINMPVMNGLAATKVIAERYTSTKVLIFSLYDDDESLSNAIEAGAKGYLFKNTPSEEIIMAIRSAHLGYFQLGPGLLERYLYRFSTNLLNNKEVNKKLANVSTIVNKTQDISFLTSKIVKDISNVERNVLLNRTLIYIMFIFTTLLLFLVIFNKA